LRTELGRTRSEFRHEYDDLKETVRDVQTELLKAFYSFAQSAVESRVTEIERRINMPPQLAE